jgi:hypothetical protein
MGTEDASLKGIDFPLTSPDVLSRGASCCRCIAAEFRRVLSTRATDKTPRLVWNDDADGIAGGTTDLRVEISEVRTAVFDLIHTFDDRCTVGRYVADFEVVSSHRFFIFNLLD